MRAQISRPRWALQSSFVRRNEIANVYVAGKAGACVKIEKKSYAYAAYFRHPTTFLLILI